MGKNTDFLVFNNPLHLLLGYIGVYVVTKDGWKKVFSEDLALVTVGFDEKSPKKYCALSSREK
jgi:hypothetical protein